VPTWSSRIFWRLVYANLDPDRYRGKRDTLRPLNLPATGPLVVAMTITLVLFTSKYEVGAAIATGAIALPIMLSQGILARVSGFQHGHRRRHDGQPSAVRYVSEVVSWYPTSITMWAVGAAIYIVCAWTMEYIHISRLEARRATSVSARLLGSMIEAMAS
jgi:hypothetical protein